MASTLDRRSAATRLRTANQLSSHHLPRKLGYALRPRLRRLRTKILAPRCIYPCQCSCSAGSAGRRWRGRASSDRGRSRLLSRGYRWFESISLQRRVCCEPDFRGGLRPRRGPPALPDKRARPQRRPPLHCVCTPLTADLQPLGPLGFVRRWLVSQGFRGSYITKRVSVAWRECPNWTGNLKRPKARRE
jgi:hypothetical protein